MIRRFSTCVRTGRLVEEELGQGSACEISSRRLRERHASRGMDLYSWALHGSVVREIQPRGGERIESRVP